MPHSTDTMNLRVVFDIVSLLILFTGIVVSFVILLRSYIHYRSLLTNMSVFLTCNTYVMLLLSCVSLFETYASTLYGDLNPSVDLQTSWCFVRYYLACICLSSLLYSYNLQAVFRLFRVIFYQRKSLQSFRLFRFALIGQWIMAILSILPQIVLNYAEYLPQEHNCQLAFANMRGFFLVLFSSHYLPLNIILLIYTAILLFTHRATHTLQHHRKVSNRRDTIVLQRIVILLLTLFIFALPTLVIVMIYWTTQYLTSWAYQIQGLSLSSNLTVQVIVLALLTPQMRVLFQRNRARVLPLRAAAALQLPTVDRCEIAP